MSFFANEFRVGGMRLTDEQKSLVRETFDRLAPRAEAAGRLFYRRLFEIAPEVRPLFAGASPEQGLRIMQALAYAVLSLDRLDELVHSAEELGRRHARYGVQDAHYDSARAALLWTFEQSLGPVFTPQVKAAWASLYGFLADAMKRGGRSAVAA